MHVHALFSTTHISTYVFNTSVLMYLTYNLAGKKTNTKGYTGSRGNGFTGANKLRPCEIGKSSAAVGLQPCPQSKQQGHGPPVPWTYRGIFPSSLSLAVPRTESARVGHHRGKGWPNTKLFQLLTAAGYSLGIQGQLAQVEQPAFLNKQRKM